MYPRLLPLLLLLPALTACGGREPTWQPSALVDHPLYEQGERLYLQVCALCHQRDGQGAEGLQPSLVGSDQAMGPDERLIEIILLGDGAFTSDSQYTSRMPPFGYLSDERVAAVATYVRGSFGNDGEAVSPDTVAEVRARLSE